MLVYKVFSRNFELKKGEFMGLLIERRKDLRGRTQVESGLKWARVAFGRMSNNEKTILVVPDELKLGIEIQWLKEKGVFSKAELLGMVKLADQVV